ncbi:MAG: Maf family protein [Verrucomicrobium sp.]|nr:Maf family protein [Verrucomicrobium sp.]
MEIPPLLLASGSPQRRKLLGLLGVPFQLAGSLPFEERTERDNRALSPHEFAWHNALGKARAAARLFPRRRILAADTTVSLGGRIFGKPRDRADAAATLRTLAGRRHTVQTAVVLVLPDGRERSAVTSSHVLFHPLSDARIARYLDAVDVMDKAGSYAVQEQGDSLIADVRGSLTNVIGLPLETVAAVLRAA